MTGPLVGVAVLQPASGTVVPPGQPRPHQLTITAFPDDAARRRA